MIHGSNKSENQKEKKPTQLSLSVEVADALISNSAREAGKKKEDQEEPTS